MIRLRVTSLALVVTLAACTGSSPTAAPASAGGQGGIGSGSSAPGAPSPAISSGAGGSGGGIVFSGVISFTGGTPVTGPFTDSFTASTETSCSAYATNGAAFQSGWFGPDPSGNSVGGLKVSVSPHVAFKDFHGPGTYTTTSFLNIAVGSTSYDATPATVVINPDSSGSLTFADAPGGPPGSNATESGTMTWTCAIG